MDGQVPRLELQFPQVPGKRLQLYPSPGDLFQSRNYPAADPGMETRRAYIGPQRDDGSEQGHSQHQPGTEPAPGRRSIVNCGHRLLTAARGEIMPAGQLAGGGNFAVDPNPALLPQAA